MNPESVHVTHRSSTPINVREDALITWARTRQNVSSGVSDQARHKPACAATETS